MDAGYTSTAVVIPTRNRPDLAMRAIRSVLGQEGARAWVLVSDNSTSEEALAALERFCAELKDERLHYVRPPEPLPMTDHWSWALRQALALFPEASHFTYVSDRIVLKPSAVRELARIAARHPSAVTSFLIDAVVDDKLPITVRQNEWTGRLLRVSSSRCLQLSAESVLHESLPRLLNCIVPRGLFAEVEGRFGSVFSSISPDFNFCYRLLTIIDSVIFYDRALSVHYALRRSNGASTSRGELTPDHADFLKNLGRMKQNYAAPIPEVATVHNAIIHEYCVVKEESRSPKFPEVDFQRYLGALAYELEEFIDPGQKQRMLSVLAGHGWRGWAAFASTPAEGPPADARRWRKALSPARVARRLSSEARGAAAAAARLLGLRPEGGAHEGGEQGPTFETLDAALEYVTSSERPRSESLPRLDEMLRPEPVPVGVAPAEASAGPLHARGASEGR